MKKLILILCGALFIMSCNNDKKKCCDKDAKKDSVAQADSAGKAPAAVHPMANSVLLKCNNNYSIKVDYAADANSMAMTVTENGKEKEPMELYSDSTAASGAKYTSKDGKTSLWESQGEFTYYVGDKAICECTDK